MLRQIYLLLFISTFSFSQESNFQYNTIPLELKAHANAVLRSEITNMEVLSISKIRKTYSRVVTVLNEKGNRYVRANVGYDNSIAIGKLEARIYSADGEEINKYRKGDFKDVSAVNGGTLYSDSRVKYMDYTPISYPYTVSFNYTWESPNTGYIPQWFPLEGYYISTEYSEFTVIIPEDLTLRKKEYNFKDYSITKEESPNTITYTAKHLLGVKPEAYSPVFSDIAPRTQFLCNPFKYEGIKGDYTTWEGVGKWMYNNLIDGRNTLNSETISKVKELTNGATSDIEKAKIIYNYLQNRTRYISVQVGIGGLQPIKATEVDKMGYGDCKGLTNYMKAMLDAVGVTSYYTHVESNRASKVSFDADFADLGAGNHVILNLPNNGNDVWLECTSQQIPFGFLGTFTDGRNVLVITPEGGKLKRTKVYSEDESFMDSTAEVIIGDNAQISATFKAHYGGIQYDSRRSLITLDTKDIEDYYKNALSYIKDFKLVSKKISNDKDNVKLSENIKITSQVYANKAGEKLLFNPNVFNRITQIPPKYLKRRLPFVIERGFKDKDVVVLRLPETYNVETLSNPITIETKFGVYRTSLKKLDDKTVEYSREFKLLEGAYTKDDYKAYRRFMRKAAKADKTPMIFTKS